jgi:hypothetical protein
MMTSVCASQPFGHGDVCFAESFDSQRPMLFQEAVLRIGVVEQTGIPHATWKPASQNIGGRTGDMFGIKRLDVGISQLQVGTSYGGH